MSSENSAVTSLQDQAKSGLPLVLPWMRKEVILGAGLESQQLQEEHPWTRESAFDLRDTEKHWLRYNSETDGRASFRESESSSHLSTTDHYSGSLGVAVGCPVVNVSVTGTYDKTVMSNSDSHKVSRNASCRAGAIVFSQEPLLSASAKELLLGDNGEEAFRRAYGDYYVGAYILGGESGAYASVDSDQTTEVNKTSLKITVKVLWFSKSHTEEKVDTSRVEHLRFTFAGFDTLEGTSDVHLPTDGRSLAQIQESSGVYLDKAEKLTARVSQAMQSLSMGQSGGLHMADCGKICHSGLVFQVLLLPYRVLRGYQIAIRGRRRAH